MNRYYNTDFDYSKPQQVQSIGTSAYVLRRSTWETVGLLDERFRWSMPDIAYNYTLHKRGFRLYYAPCTSVVHFGGQTASQDVLRVLREQRESFLYFSEQYNYFGSNPLVKLIVRVGIEVRYYSRAAVERGVLAAWFRLAPGGPVGAAELAMDRAPASHEGA
jgi:hypothetical protein